MLLLPILVFPILSTILPHLAMANPFSDHSMIVLPADTQPPPKMQLRRRTIVSGLPAGWVAVFQTVTSIQPPLIAPVFTQFFSQAAKAAAADPVPGRHVQRIPFGALVLEFIANGDQNQLVTKEFVEAASLWLLDAAQKGWTGFFNAWVVDRADGEIVFVRLTTVWDRLVSLSY